MPCSKISVASHSNFLHALHHNAHLVTGGYSRRNLVRRFSGDDDFLHLRDNAVKATLQNGWVGTVNRDDSGNVVAVNLTELPVGPIRYSFGFEILARWDFGLNRADVFLTVETGQILRPNSNVIPLVRQVQVWAGC